MFEQSILAKENPATKTRALAASFGLQALILAVGLLIPLIFGEHMPGIQLLTKLSAPSPLKAEPVEVARSSTPSGPQSILPARPRVWFTPASNSHAPASAGPTVISDSFPSAFADGQGNIGVPGGLGALPPLDAVAVPQPKPVAPPAPPATRPVRVTSEMQAAMLIRKVIPEYPLLAKQARISGTVRLTSVISKDGRIEQLEVLSGSPLLIPAALAAVKQWLYRPTYLNGQPVEVIAPIDVIFRLSQ